MESNIKTADVELFKIIYSFQMYTYTYAHRHMHKHVSLFWKYANIYCCCWNDGGGSVGNVSNDIISSFSYIKE